MKSFLGVKMKRKLINKNEDKASWLQIIGFLLILAGILYLVANMFFLGITAEEAAIIFFDIMLGVAFAFPDMLQDDSHQVSTMRIVVFMFVNVICMLLLKIGWDKTSFKQIEIDSYWMGIIAFLFGAKVAQSFFESWAIRKATSNRFPGIEDEKDEGEIKPVVSQGDPRQAIKANSAKLIKDNPNIKKLIPSYYSDGNNRIPCVDICISDNAKQKIPSLLKYKEPDGKIMQIKTRVITNFDNAKPHIARGHFIANVNSRLVPGTACCILEGSEPDKQYLLTCNHVMTGGNFDNPGNIGAKAVRFISGNTFDDVGIWKFGKMDDKVDAAIIDIENTERIETNDINPYIYTVSENDCSQTEIEFKGAFSKTKRAFIIHIHQPFDVDYDNKTITMSDLITLSEDLNHFNFSSPTQKGDSGSLVYHANTRQPIGMVVGGNSQFSFVVPFQTILDAFPHLQLKLPNN
jgi:hypothetical protein